MKKQMLNEQLYEIANRFFIQIKVPVTSHSLRKHLFSHPDYSSLAGLSGVCEKLQIEHAVLKLLF